MKHATCLADLGLETVERVLSNANHWKKEPPGKHLAEKILGLLFFNPSLRTRPSFEAVMLRGGGSAITLDAGNDTWKLEDRIGAVMDGDRPEHLKEAAAVLSRYVDALGLRTFASGVDDESIMRTASSAPLRSMPRCRS